MGLFCIPFLIYKIHPNYSEIPCFCWMAWEYIELVAIAKGLKILYKNLREYNLLRKFAHICFNLLLSAFKIISSLFIYNGVINIAVHIWDRAASTIFRAIVSGNINITTEKYVIIHVEVLYTFLYFYSLFNVHFIPLYIYDYIPLCAWLK